MKSASLSLLAAALFVFTVIGCSGGAPKIIEKEAGPPEDGREAAITGVTGEVKCGAWTILDTRTDLTDRARAKQNVEDALTANSDLGCLVGLWSYNGPAILSAVQGQNKVGKVQIVAFDEEADTLQGILDGAILGTVVQQPFEFGYQSVKLLASLAKGDKTGIPANGVMDIPIQILKKGDVEGFKGQLAERLKSGETSPTAKVGAASFAFVTNNASDFWKIARAGVNKAVGELGVNVDFRMPADGTPTEQQRIVEDLITRKISGMAISPVDPKNQVDMLNKACDVMSVVTQDSDAPASKRLCYIGTNNYRAGRAAGKLIKEALPNGGKLMLFVGKIDAQNAMERQAGIIDELSGKPEK
ncbi:MAG: substrate-binding domain-containing protein [Armatimonadetes bacterium]|nr:substrate-binding domain-containing protein [Armatimonadota bacterium]